MNRELTTELKARATQAIVEGYTYCVAEHHEDVLIKLTEVMNYPELFEHYSKIFLCEKETSTISVSDDQIADFIIDHLNNQDEFYSEDWDESLDGCDAELKALSDKLNANLSKKKFWFNSSIEL